MEAMLRSLLKVIQIKIIKKRKKLIMNPQILNLWPSQKVQKILMSLSILVEEKGTKKKIGKNTNPTETGVQIAIVITREVRTKGVNPEIGLEILAHQVYRSSPTGRILARSVERKEKREGPRIKSETNITITVQAQKKIHCRPGRIIL